MVVVFSFFSCGAGVGVAVVAAVLVAVLRFISNVLKLLELLLTTELIPGPIHRPYLILFK